ncbi:MAG: nitrogenase iron protein NifH [Phascolarctobacterium sp.]|nr:nitrogenase iron protein NifH [Phascolarctobacterium sp.]
MKTIKIAFYGKGGIGKSTLATNVAALLASKGLRVLHIGCDPKADSTRLLTERRLPTVLQQLDALDEIKREDLLFTGKCGVTCVETGGPEAGTGCAGLGITAAMDELTRLGVFDEAWDYIIYDVLGDVVCGGFSVPMRQHYVDKVFVVVAPNYMSIYAANNILKGVARYSQEQNLCGGLIANHLQNNKEKALLKAYAEAVNVQICLEIAEDLHLQKADFKRQLFALEGEENTNRKSLQQFVEGWLKGGQCVIPTPFSADELEAFGQLMAENLYE